MESEDSPVIAWSLCGCKMCLSSFCILLGVNEKRVTLLQSAQVFSFSSLCQTISGGGDQNVLHLFEIYSEVMRLLVGVDDNLVPQDKRKYNGRAPSKSNSVDAFFTYYYWNFAACLLMFLQVTTKNMKMKISDSLFTFVHLVVLQAETLAEEPPQEELRGAAMCTSGLCLPSPLDYCTLWFGITFTQVPSNLAAAHKNMNLFNLFVHIVWVEYICLFVPAIAQQSLSSSHFLR